MSLVTLLASLRGKAVIELSSKQQVQAAILFNTQAQRTPEESAAMAEHYLVVPITKLLELERLNQGQNTLAQPVPLKDGSRVLPITLLSDCDFEDTYDHLKRFLMGLKIRHVSANDWPTPDPDP